MQHDSKHADAGHVDTAIPAGEDVASAFANQIGYCRANDATVTGRVVAVLAALLAGDDPAPFLARVRAWPGPALANGVPLRCAGAFHALHLGGKVPALAPIYAGAPADDEAVLLSVIRAHGDALMPFLDGPPQTNEAGRSAGFAAAMLWLGAQGLPPRFEALEIGSSAGINLMMDRYAYDLGGVKVGPADPVMTLVPEWRGLPPPSGKVDFAAISGCDVAPVDLTDPAQALRLKAFVWPEHHVRFARIAAAIAAAEQRPPDLVKMPAADFVEAALARPQAEGTAWVWMHLVVGQSVLAPEQARIRAAMAEAAARATLDRPLAWIALEADRSLMAHQLHVRFWPGEGTSNHLASAHAHGAWIHWRG